MEQRGALTSEKRELVDAVKREIQKIIEAIKAGFIPSELKAEMDALQDRVDGEPLIRGFGEHLTNR